MDSTAQRTFLCSLRSLQYSCTALQAATQSMLGVVSRRRGTHMQATPACQTHHNAQPPCDSGHKNKTSKAHSCTTINRHDTLTLQT